jgi:protein required for attachment to host cells
MMKHHWILVANACQARLFTRASPAEPLVHLLTMHHAPDWLDSEETDPGRLGREDLRVAPQDRSRREEHEHDQFAREIVRHLHAQAVIGNFSTLSIFAPNPFFGALKRHLSPAVRNTVGLAVDADLNDLSLFEIALRLPKPRPVISLRHLHV